MLRTAQLEKKRHIGNDVIVIVFHEGSSPFDPSKFHSQFNHIFMVVRPVQNHSGEVEYRYLLRARRLGGGLIRRPSRLAMAAKSGVPVFAPELPSPAIFTKENLREFLFAKGAPTSMRGMRVAMRATAVINGERAVIHYAPAFAKRLNKARLETLQLYDKTYSE